MPTTRAKWCRNVAGSAKPTAAPTCSIEASPVSSSALAAVSRWPISQRNGVVPVGPGEVPQVAASRRVRDLGQVGDGDGPYQVLQRPLHRAGHPLVVARRIERGLDVLGLTAVPVRRDDQAPRHRVRHCGAVIRGRGPGLRRRRCGRRRRRVPRRPGGQSLRIAGTRGTISFSPGSGAVLQWTWPPVQIVAHRDPQRPQEISVLYQQSS